MRCTKCGGETETGEHVIKHSINQSESAALLTELNSGGPAMEVAKFRSIFGDDYRKILSKLEITCAANSTYAFNKTRN